MVKLQSLLDEFQQEAEITRKMLSLIPDDRFGWQPHKKSMTIQALATHLGEIPGWVQIVLTTSELDFSTDPQPKQVENREELLSFFDACVKKGKAALENASPEDLIPNWTMRNGDYIISVRKKADVLRMCFSQTVHHRAQLGVYLRLLNIPIPGSYGPSADELEKLAEFAKA